jgi:dTDP-L-rhamnose 4-epimerase
MPVNGKRVLITGGAGFVGSHTADALLRSGHEVTIYDNLSEQVHGSKIPDYLCPDLNFITGDVRDRNSLSKAVRHADVIFHLAAAVGVGQSMYAIADYTEINNLGTANLLQAILDSGARPEKIVVASSMSIYGEGSYRCPQCGNVNPEPRPAGQLRRKQWETVCPQCGESLQPIATREEKPLQCTSIYALSKKDQEEMTLMFGRTYGISAVALRYFNIYGPRQALSNPYTGVAAIFASRMLNGNAPLVFEDGLQRRDFVSVHDIVQANVLAMEVEDADGQVFNIGSGQPVNILQIAEALAQALGNDREPQITGKYRTGDIRHCFGDISLAQEKLGYAPRINLRQGMDELANWLSSQQADDHVEEAFDRLNVHGLVA